MNLYCIDLFHHLFTTASRSSCYLAPEQLLSPEGASDMLNFNGTFEMDYFATGLVLYYLYTGEHFFTFLRLHQYKIGQFKIDNQIEKLPDEIKKLISSLLSLDPNERKLDPKNLNQYFPEISIFLFVQYKFRCLLMISCVLLNNLRILLNFSHF